MWQRDRTGGSGTGRAARGPLAAADKKPPGDQRSAALLVSLMKFSFRLSWVVVVSQSLHAVHPIVDLDETVLLRLNLDGAACPQILRDLLGLRKSFFTLYQSNCGSLPMPIGEAAGHLSLQVVVIQRHHLLPFILGLLPADRLGALFLRVPSPCRSELDLQALLSSTFLLAPLY